MSFRVRAQPESWVSRLWRARGRRDTLEDMLRRERGQVAAEYVGMLLLVAVIVAALVVSGPAQRIAGETVRAAST